MRNHLACLLLLSSLFACKTTAPSSPQAEPLNFDASEQAQLAFASLRAQFNPYEIQDDPAIPNDCGPYYMPAEPEVAFRGTAVFFHGFTACPQQYYEMSRLLAKKGFASFVPLLPGQGRGPVPTVGEPKKVGGRSYSEYYGEYLPAGKAGREIYADFVAQVNDFMRSLPGEKAVGGLSVGGSLATYAYVESPGTYQRALIMSPFYGIAETYLGRKSDEGILGPLKKAVGNAIYLFSETVATDLSGSIPGLGERGAGWGAECYEKQKDRDGKVGRRGICDFRLTNIAAIHEFGDELIKTLKESASQNALPRIHYVSIEWDAGANTRLLRKAMAYQQVSGNSLGVSSCWYGSPVPHSFFSREDLSFLPSTPWLESFLAQATDYLAFGEDFKVGGVSEERLYDPLQEKDTDQALQRCAIFP